MDRKERVDGRRAREGCRGRRQGDGADQRLAGGG